MPPPDCCVAEACAGIRHVGGLIMSQQLAPAIPRCSLFCQPPQPLLLLLQAAATALCTTVLYCPQPSCPAGSTNPPCWHHHAGFVKDHELCGAVKQASPKGPFWHSCTDAHEQRQASVMPTGGAAMFPPSLQAAQRAGRCRPCWEWVGPMVAEWRPDLSASHGTPRHAAH
jgi:hypothetical protein